MVYLKIKVENCKIHNVSFFYCMQHECTKINGTQIPQILRAEFDGILQYFLPP